MNRFSDFTNKNLNDFVEKNKSKLEDLKTTNNQEVNELNNIINRYSSMSKDEIFNEFVKVVQQKKRDGALDLQYFNNVKASLFPFLSEEQKVMFNNLMNYLR